MVDAKKINFNENCFDLLRLIAACIVMLSHSFRHFEISKPIWLMYFTDGSVGVMMFFSISGYLISSSWDRVRDKENAIKKYIKNRVLRLYPAIVFCFLFITVLNIIFGIDIFHFNYLGYFVKNFIIPFGGGYNGGFSNGAFWTLKCEIFFYCMVPFCSWIFRKFNVVQWLIVIAFFLHFNIFDSYYVNLLGGQNRMLSLVFGASGVIYFIYEFLIGVFFYYKGKKILSYVTSKTLIAIMLAWSAFYYIYEYLLIIPKPGVMHNWIKGMMVPFILNSRPDYIEEAAGGFIPMAA